MAVTVTHSTVATLPDEVGAEVNKAEWNAAHTIVGLGTAAEAATTDFDAAGTAAAAVTAHEGAVDPHPQYLTAAEGGAAYDALGSASAAVAAHEGAADPHTGYQKESEKNAASGYAGLSAGSKLDGAQQTYGTLANTACEGNDARLSDSRTPLAHAASHVTGGADIIATFGAAAVGLVPASGGGTTTFLRADGTFAAPTAAAADPSYSPGSFTVVTETQRFAPHLLKMTTSQRITIEGTGRLSCLN